MPTRFLLHQPDQSTLDLRSTPFKTCAGRVVVFRTRPTPMGGTPNDMLRDYVELFGTIRRHRVGTVMTSQGRVRTAGRISDDPPCHRTLVGPLAEKGRAIGRGA